MRRYKSTYYGAFFWLALISFVVPMVVAARAFQSVDLTSKPTPDPDVSGVDNALWDYLLKTYVENGAIDYEGMARDHVFRTYLKQLSEADPSKLKTDEEKLALYCNAYNAFVVNGVIVHKIKDSVLNYKQNELGFFDVREHILSGQTMSLNYLEHQVIREQFKEPRIHVALVCAAKSCPAIRPEAYTGKQLDKQLADQSRLFANNPKYVAYDQASNTLQLNRILEWYGPDWNETGGYLQWLVDHSDSAEMQNVIVAAGNQQVQIAFMEYDWELNAQKATSPAKQQTKSGSEFGSGSVPNN